VPLNRLRAIERLGTVMLGALLLATTACQPSDGPTTPSGQPSGPRPDTIPAAGSPLRVNLAFCDALTEFPTGRLCAVQPSRTQPSIRDFASGSRDTPGPGYGYHVIGVPADWNRLKGVWLHFSGAFGSPYQPGGRSAGEFVSAVWMQEVVRQGYLVIGIAYANPVSVNGDLCGPTTPGIAVDNCAGDVRREILEGVDHSRVVSVSRDDGVYNRLDRLLAYLTARGLTLPSYAQSGAVNWSQIHVSGHSQGAGHAYYLAKQVGVRSACFLGGPYDFADRVNPGTVPIADWYTVPGSRTAPANMGAFVVTTDDSYATFVLTYDLIGLIKNTTWFEAGGTHVNAAGAPIDGHAASVAAPALESGRAQACF
jgi:hypothetical protein